MDVFFFMMGLWIDHEITVQSPVIDGVNPRWARRNAKHCF